MKDSRIKSLYQLVDSGKYDLISLDVFDTTLFRMVPTPIDVFFLVAQKLRKLGAMRDSSTMESYVRERINAEKRARKKKYYCTEVNMEEIYAEFPNGYLKNFSLEKVLRIEFEIEKMLVRILPDMGDFILYAKKNKRQVAFVSDTYFSSDQIKELIGLDVDYLIVSSEYNVSKYHGLHGVLLEQSGLDPSRILHVGDNDQADVEGPALFGIDSFWFQKFPGEYGELIQNELPSIFTKRARVIQSDDGGLTWLRSQSAFACETDYGKWGAVVLGPIISGFSDWVVERCLTEGITSIMCLMREGRILKKVLDLNGSDLSVQEVFISRYAALKAAIFEATKNELAKFVYRPSPQKAEKILDQLGLEDNDLAFDIQKTLSPQDTLALIDAVSKDTKLKRKVVASSRQARENLIKHLSKIIDFEQPQTIALVDLGYKGTIQENLSKIFIKEKLPIKTHGLYLVTGGDVYQTQSNKMAVEGWLAENGQPLAMAHTFMRSPEIVEQSLMADCGSTLGHNNNGDPVLDEFVIPELQKRQITEIQEGMMVFCRSWSRYRNKNLPHYSSKLKKYYQNICIRSVANPMNIELKLFKDWEHDENFGSNTSRKLTVSTLDKWELNHVSAHQLASLPSSSVYWPFGMASLLGNHMKDAVANIYLRTVEPEVFDSSEKKYLIFYWDSGRGFNKDESKVESYKLNNRGKVWKRFSLNLKGAKNRAIGFNIGLVDEIIQLTGVKITCEKKDEKRKVTMFTPDQIEKSGYKKIHHNLYLVEEDPSLFAIATDDIGHFTGMVYVDVFFSVVEGA